MELDKIRHELAKETGFEYDPNCPFGGLPELPPDKRRTPAVYSRRCYICNDPSFAAYGLPLCRACPACRGHIAADDTRCDECGLDDQGFWELVRMVEQGKMDINEARTHIDSCFVDKQYKTVGPPSASASGAAKIALWRVVNPGKKEST